MIIPLIRIFIGFLQGNMQLRKIKKIHHPRQMKKKNQVRKKAKAPSVLIIVMRPISMQKKFVLIKIMLTRIAPKKIVVISRMNTMKRMNTILDAVPTKNVQLYLV